MDILCMVAHQYCVDNIFYYIGIKIKGFKANARGRIYQRTHKTQ